MPRKKAAPVVFEPQGAVDITHARQLRDDLLAAIAGGKEVQVKLNGVKEVDLSFIQLLCAGHREATKQGKKMSVDASGMQDAVKQMLLEGGITRQFECQHARGQQCLWCGEGW